MSRKKRKHSRIRTIDSNEDIEALFTGKASDTPPDFSSLIESSLTGDAVAQFLREKYADNSVLKKTPVKQIIKQYPGPEKELDLHRLHASDAEEKTRQFVHDAAVSGLKTLRIIVGKGIHSQAEPVLPDIIENLLSLLKKSGSVLTFEWEKREKRRSGSIIVYLNKNRPSHRSPS